MKRKGHPDKDIEAAVLYAEQRGWQYMKTGQSAHAWGRLYCPLNTRAGCVISVWSTPKSSINHSRQIRRLVLRCPHWWRTS